MNNLGVLIALIVVIVVISLGYIYFNSSSSTVTILPITRVSSIGNSTTSVAGAAGSNKTATNGSATSLATPAICSSYSGSLCTAVTCTPVNSTFTCSNVAYVYVISTNATEMYANISQNTGREWSSFGIAYVPSGAKIISGTPQNVAWYSENYTSTSNVGTSLSSNQMVAVRPDIGETGAIFQPTANGSIWACYTNSGLVYVGPAGCKVNGGGSKVATYVEIATVRPA